MGDKEKVGGMDSEGLPKTIVRRLVKDKLSLLSNSDTDTDISLLRDALLAFSESARIFIHYLSATANDICKESKRQTINAEDVFKALEEIEFPEFIEPLRASLDVFREKNSKRKSGGSSKSTESNKKAKLKEPVENGKGKAKEQASSDNENEDREAKEQASSGDENEDREVTEQPSSDNENEDREVTEQASSDNENEDREAKEQPSSDNENEDRESKEQPSDNENEDEGGEESNEGEDSADN